MNRTVNATIGLVASDAPSDTMLSGIRATLTSVALAEPVEIVIPASEIVQDAAGNAVIVATFREVPPGAFSVVAVSLDQNGDAIPGFAASGSGLVPQPNRLLRPSSVDIRLA